MVRMHNQLIRGLIFLILVFLVTSDLKEIFSALATSGSLGAFLHQSASSPSSSHHQRSRRQAAGSGSAASSRRYERASSTPPSPVGNDEEEYYEGDTIKFTGSSASRSGVIGGGGDNVDADSSDHSSDEFNDDNETLDPVRKRLSSRGQTLYANKKRQMKPNEEEKKELLAMKSQLTSVMQEWCLPKLVCELHASLSDRGSLTDAEKGLLNLIRETSIGTMGEVVSRYHFAAHMGQLISGVEGTGCHNFYPNCPLSGNKVLQMMKKVRIR